VHVYNANLLFMCELLYYDTNSFASVLQMLDLEQATPVTKLWLVENHASRFVRRESRSPHFRYATNLFSDPSFFKNITGYFNYAVESCRDDARFESEALVVYISATHRISVRIQLLLHAVIFKESRYRSALKITAIHQDLIF
jgi:hypothetical protein